MENNFSESEVHLSEENLSAQKASEKSGAWLQKENEHGKRQKGSEEKTPEGQSKTVLLSFFQKCCRSVQSDAKAI